MTLRNRPEENPNEKSFNCIRKQKSKEPELSEPKPSGSNTLVIRPQVPQIQDQSDSSSTWIEESSKGEDDADCVPESIKQRIHDTVPAVVAEKLTEPVRKYDIHVVQVDPNLARCENLEASRGASNNDQVPESQSIESSESRRSPAEPQPRRTPGEPQPRRTPAELEAAPPHRCTAAGDRQSLEGAPSQPNRRTAGRRSLPPISVVGKGFLFFFF
nr:hypothetical protein Iba_chr13fCG5710 [Ipomoea batatas]